MARLSAHLTDGPTAVTAVLLCCELPAMPRACFCGSHHRASVLWASICAESLLCLLSAHMVCTVGSLCAESGCQNSRQSSLVLWACLLPFWVLITNYCC
jgi:hypothetical protein